MPNHDERFSIFFEKQLNPEQQAAVRHKSGVLVVRAGAGSGKTRVITARITHLLLKNSVAPGAILALTFTNKAAREMKERMLDFVSTALPYVGTFHSYCLRILKTEPDFFSSSFTVLDENDQQSLLKTIIKRAHLEKKITARQAAASFSHIKNQSPSDVRLDPLMQQLYALYEKEKSECHALDFDDLLLEVLKLFKTSALFKARFQERIRHILIDEYQDTNTVQHELLKHMAQSPDKTLAIDSVCVVGDEDQSIYSWRGATVTNILNFARDFPGAHYITIEQNYRSVQPILNAANSVIQHNDQRKPKKLWSDRNGNDRIRIVQCASEYHEAEAIALKLKLASRAHSLNDYAILYRSHYQSRSLEEALIRHALPYKIIGGLQFYERLEIKDLLAYLRLVVNPFDRVAFSRIINSPNRGLGDKFQQQFMSLWHQHYLYDFKHIADLLLKSNELPKAKRDSLEEFLALYQTLSPYESATTALDKILRCINYIHYLKNNFEPEEATTKIENVHELAQAVAFFETQKVATLAAFLDEVALMQEFSRPGDETNCVKLMTIHAAKGLEYETIILAGFEDGIFPSAHAINDVDRLEEERRLLYVAITRAKERLLVTHSRYRSIWGQINNQDPSRFLREFPEEYIQHHDGSYWSSAQLLSYFSSWLKITHDAKTYSTIRRREW